MVPTSQHGTVLLTGGTGRVGTCLVEIFAPTPIPYLIASRSATKPQSVEFDWLDRSTWDGPFTKSNDPPVQAVFLLAPPVTKSSSIMNALVDLARTKYGVKRFVLLGSTAVEPGGPLMGDTTKYLAELGARGEAEFTVLRPTWFQDNWSEQGTLRKSIKDEAKCYSATGEGKIPWVSKSDVAACAFQALTAEESVNGDLFILGSELLSYADCARIITEVTGKRITHVNISCDELAVRHMRGVGLPEEYAKDLAMMDLRIGKGSEEKLNNIVSRVTGKQPKTFRTFAEQNKNVWI